MIGRVMVLILTIAVVFEVFVWYLKKDDRDHAFRVTWRAVVSLVFAVVIASVVMNIDRIFN